MFYVSCRPLDDQDQTQRSVSDQLRYGQRHLGGDTESVHHMMWWEALQLDLQSGMPVLLYIHGAKNDLNIALRRAAQLTRELDRVVVAFCWPTAPWLAGALAGYLADEHQLPGSAPHLRDAMVCLAGQGLKVCARCCAAAASRNHEAF